MPQRRRIKDYNVEGHLFPKHPLMIDVGAWRGRFALSFLKAFPRAKVIAFEPNQECVRYMRYTARQQGVWSRLFLFQKAVGLTAATGVRFFQGRGDAEQSSSLVPRDLTGYQVDEVEVEVVGMADTLTSYKRIDFLKVNIEGAEWDIIWGLDLACFRSVRQFCIGLHTDIGSDGRTPEEAGVMFDAVGFDCYLREYRKAGPRRPQLYGVQRKG